MRTLQHHLAPRSPARARRGPSRTQAARLAVLGVAIAALTALPALSASAHDQLVSATPAAGATVSTVLRSVDLTFDAALLELGGGRNGVVVTDAAGRHYETSCAVVSGDGMTVPVRLGAAGTYSVGWRGVSSDGHEVADTYTFVYRPPTGTAAAAGSADGPSCGAAAGAASPTAAAAQDATGGAIVAGAVGGAVLLAVVAAVLVVVLRLRRAQDEEGRP